MHDKAMDCGSGHDFVLPHLSPADREGPNKLLGNVSTVPMKVCNGLIHGNRRSHAILSPGVVGATASHTIECMLIMINEVLEVHGVMPEEYTLQMRRCCHQQERACVDSYGFTCDGRCVPASATPYGA